MGSEVRISSRPARQRPGPKHPARVMIVDDSVTVRSVMSRAINSQPDLEVVAKHSSAELAIRELDRTTVDVVLLDLEMPGMGGLDALPKILAHQQGPQVMVVSTLTEEGAEPTLAALSMGAADTMAKPRSGGFDDEYCNALFGKIRALAPNRAVRRQTLSKPKPPAKNTSIAAPAPKRAKVLAIGASTGGIHAMCILLRNLPADFELPIVVTQHLPDTFMSVFARQLELAAGRKAVIAQNGTLLEPRTIYIAPGTGHLEVIGKGEQLECRINTSPTPNGFMPSVDPMLESLATATDGRAIGVILSGMGRDGSAGASKLAASGGQILAQDQESSAVWGMPRAVHERGLVTATLPPSELGARLAQLAGGHRWK